MKKILPLLLIFIPIVLFSQVNVSSVKKESRQIFVYKIPADSAEKYLRKDNIPVDEFESQQPAFVFEKDSLKKDLLPVGNYVAIRVNDINVVAWVINSTNLLVYPVNNQYKVQIEVRTKNGDFISDAKVFVNDKKAAYNADAQTYWMQTNRKNPAFVKVCTQGDTSFFTLEKDDDDRVLAIWKQRWNHFKYTKTGHVITWIPMHVASLFKKHRRWHSPYVKNYTSGFMVFNQPKYKLIDTIKLKAYIIDKHNNRYKKEAAVYLEYYNKGKSVSQLLTKLLPQSPGSYLYSFPLNDSLPMDINYTIAFKTAEGKPIIHKQFKVEDYVLDEIGKYNLRTEKEMYFPDDSLHLFASAKDANDLPLLDGKLRLLLLSNTISLLEKDTLYVPDTLYNVEKILDAIGDTKFSIPARVLPKANISITAKAIFKNSNNELHEESVNLSYNQGNKEIVSTIEADSIEANYRVNGKVVAAKGELKVEYEAPTKTTQINYPYKAKIDPMVERYKFSVIENGKELASNEEKIDKRYKVDFFYNSNKDSAGFALHNTYRIPVNYIVLNGNKVIASGKSSEEWITWKKEHPNKHRLYTVKWQYYWGGKQQQNLKEIVVFYNTLDVKTNGATNIFPGQTDTIKVSVEDYKSRPAKNVNLTVYSYNSQYKADIKEITLPQFTKYKKRNILLHHPYIQSNDEIYGINSYQLGKHQGWRKVFGLDSMTYYQMLFPPTVPFDVATHIDDIVPQISVHVTEKGVPQEIYILYLNRRLVYYNGVTEKMKDAFRTFNYYNQIGIRLKDKYIEIDSIYAQQFYKHDFVFDVNNLPKNARIKIVPTYYTNEEKDLLEKKIMTIDDKKGTYYNTATVWQGDRIVDMNYSYNNLHKIGPFEDNDSTHFFAPENFDTHFKFEHGYSYGIAKGLVRLEKTSLFPYYDKKVWLNDVKTTNWTIRDTLQDSPAIFYTPTKKQRYINYTLEPRLYPEQGRGKLDVYFSRDSVYKYLILYPEDSINKRIYILNIRYHTNLEKIPSGKYGLLLVTENFYTQKLEHLLIRDNQRLCVKTKQLPYSPDNAMVTALIVESMHPVFVAPKVEKEKPTIDEIPLENPSSGYYISGKVIDKKGKLPISDAIIRIEGTVNGTKTNREGNFVLRVNRMKEYNLEISTIGYERKKIHVTVNNDEIHNLVVGLDETSSALNEVLVIGYGSVKRKELTGSIVTVSAMNMYSNYLTGKVTGVQARQDDGVTGSSTTFMIRGNRSINDNSPLYVVDGVIVEGIEKLTQDEIETTDILKDAAATAIYGARGANGVVIVTTKNKAALRTRFKDYAFWQPELFTNKKGKAQFVVTYPDNITKWETFILAMDKKNRSGKATAFVQSYKPVMAQLSMPQFLIEGDSVLLIGKSLNYTSINYPIKTKFSLYGTPYLQQEKDLGAKESWVTPLPLIAPAKDSLKASFSLKTNTSFKDGEERSIPILPKGLEETTGQFWIIDKDTTVSFTKQDGSGGINISMLNNTLDVLLNEIDHINQYPFYCMEQTTSKLRGLLMKKQINETLNLPFKEQKDVDFLLHKIQKAQLFEGAWGWWDGTNANLHITNYILRSLLPLRNDPMVEVNVRNALLYLQNKLPVLDKYEILETLLSMSEAKHEMNYIPWLQKIKFDSITQHQQWQFVKIKQLLNLDHQQELQKLLYHSTPTMLGGIHWGEETYHWYNDEIATSVCAFDVLRNEKKQSQMLPRIIQYFLENRRNGYWTNTVESASIVATILPYVLQINKNFNQPATITVTGDTNFVVNSFPYKTSIKASGINYIHFNKSGGGMVYLSAYQKTWNTKPTVVSNKFVVDYYFENNGEKTTKLTAGEKTEMIVNIDVLADADYVMLEMPIPAGCIYGAKPQDDYIMHKEYFKNKVVVFAESLKKGMHRFTINLEPRYTGSFTLNPIKAELMYFPTFYGRNSINNVLIK